MKTWATITGAERWAALDTLIELEVELAASQRCRSGLIDQDKRRRLYRSARALNLYIIA